MPSKQVQPNICYKIERVILDCTDGQFDKAQGTARPIYKMSLSEIETQLQKRYSIDVSTETIRNYLEGRKDQRKPIGVTPVKIDDITGAELWACTLSKKSGSTLYYFAVRHIDKTQIQYMIQFLRSSSTAGTAPEAIFALTNMLCEQDRCKIEDIVSNTIERSNPYRVQFETTMHTIERLQEAINQHRPVSYRYVSNDKEGIFHRNKIPLCIEMSEGYTYVVEKTHYSFVMVRTDMIRDVRFEDAAKLPYYPTDNFEELQQQARSFIRGAVNRMAKRQTWVVARCHDERMRKYVQDVFGNKEGFTEIAAKSNKYWDYRFKASLDGTRIQAIKWMSWFEVLQPKNLHDEIIDVIENNQYGTFEKIAPRKPKRSVTIKAPN